MESSELFNIASHTCGFFTRGCENDLFYIELLLLTSQKRGVSLRKVLLKWFIALLLGIKIYNTLSLTTTATIIIITILYKDIVSCGDRARRHSYW